MTPWSGLGKFFYKKKTLRGARILFCISPRIFKMSSTEQWLEHILASPVTEDDLRSGMKHRSLSEDAFLALMHHDLTFGGFGMPMAQQDPYLDVVALTAFQPYDNDVVDAATRGQAAMEDTVIILTPIYR